MLPSSAACEDTVVVLVRSDYGTDTISEAILALNEGHKYKPPTTSWVLMIADQAGFEEIETTHSLTATGQPLYFTARQTRWHELWQCTMMRGCLNAMDQIRTRVLNIS